MLAAIALLVTAPSVAGEIFFDEARVLAAEPEYETRYTAVPTEQCGERVGSARAAPPDAALLGDPRARDPSAGIADALHADALARAPQAPVYRCETVTRMEPREILVGYRVRYEYAGHVYERRIADAPGDKIRVRVRLTAGRADLMTQSGAMPSRYVAAD